MDKNLLLRTGLTSLTANETLTSTQVGPMAKPLYLHILVPSIAETDDAIDVEVEFCTAAAPTVQVYNMNLPQIVAAGHYATPFITKLENIQVKLAVTDADTGSDFDAGAVKVWVSTSQDGAE